MKTKKIYILVTVLKLHYLILDSSSNSYLVAVQSMIHTTLGTGVLFFFIKRLLVNELFCNNAD